MTFMFSAFLNKFQLISKKKNNQNQKDRTENQHGLFILLQQFISLSTVSHPESLTTLLLNEPDFQ